MVQTINNPDGTVSIIQIDAAPQSIVTLPDGTQATVVQCVSMIQSPKNNYCQFEILKY
jgi:nuclear respiratory factor 1